tara:strand:- start:291 stop:527 length:237 start_codon:yes stop_codon:yes gene_type:complete
MTLLEQLRPEIAKALEKNRDKYDFSITELYNSLDNKFLYSQLSVGEMRDLTLWADVDERTWDYVDWKYGIKLFRDEIR